MKLTDYKTAGIPSIQIDLNVPAKQRWCDAGEEYAEKLSVLTDFAWDDLMRRVDELPKQWRTLIKAGASPAGAFAGRYASFLGGEYADELQGLARAAKVSFGKLFILNLSYDIVQLVDSGGNACSSASFGDSRGRPILARNLDWEVPEGLGPFTVLVEIGKKGRTYQSVGILGFVGVLSAMRRDAWAVTLNQAPCLKGMESKFLYPACMQLRSACDSSMSYRSLRNNISNWQPMTPFLAHIVGTKRDEQSLIQHAGEYCWDYEKSPDISFLAQTNHFLDEEEGFSINEQSGWGSECERLARLNSRLKRKSQRTLADGMKLLKGAPLTHEGTIQQMVLRPATGSMQLRVRV